MEVEHHQVMTANGCIMVGTNSYKKVKTVNYLGFLLTNQNSIHEEIKSRVMTGN